MGSPSGGASDNGPSGSDNGGGAREAAESKKSESSQTGMTGSERTQDSEKESFDNALSDAGGKPGPTSPNDDDKPANDNRDTDNAERAAGPPGIGAPPSAPDMSNQPDDDDSQPASNGGLFGGGPAVDSYGNPRSNSPVADRINNTENYSFEEVATFLGGEAEDAPALTPEQSQALADGAAVIDGYAIVPANMPSAKTGPGTAAYDAAVNMANAELSVGLAVQRREIETLADRELAHIDGELANAKNHRADVLERYEAAANVTHDDLGVPQQASGFEIDQHAADLAAANDWIDDLEDERAVVEKARNLPDAIERGFMAEDMYNEQSHLRGSHLERLVDSQLPADLKTSDMVNPETGFVAGIYENHRTGTVNLVARGTDFGLSTEEFAKDMVANGGQGLGLSTAQYEQARTLGVDFAREFAGREQLAIGHSLAGALSATMAGAAGINATTYNSAGLHDTTMETVNMNRSLYQDRVTNFRVEGELVTFGQESPVVQAGVTAVLPGLAAIASIRNSGDPIPNAIGEQHSVSAANPESSRLDKHGMREVMESLFQEQQRVIDDLGTRQAAR